MSQNIFVLGADFLNDRDYKLYIHVIMCRVRAPRQPGSYPTKALDEVEAITPSATARVWPTKHMEIEFQEPQKSFFSRP